MKTTLLAAGAAVGLDIAPASAADMPKNSGYVYPDFWGGAALQQAPTTKAPPAQSNSATIGTYTTRSSPTALDCFPLRPTGADWSRTAHDLYRSVLRGPCRRADCRQYLSDGGGTRAFRSS